MRVIQSASNEMYTLLKNWYALHGVWNTKTSTALNMRRVLRRGRIINDLIEIYSNWMQTAYNLHGENGGSRVIRDVLFQQIVSRRRRRFMVLAETRAPVRATFGRIADVISRNSRQRWRLLQLTGAVNHCIIEELHGPRRFAWFLGNEWNVGLDLDDVLDSYTWNGWDAKTPRLPT